METDDSFTSSDSPLPDAQVEAIRQLIREEVRRALAELAPAPIMAVTDEVQKHLLQRILSQPYRERIVIGEPNATMTPVHWQAGQEVPTPMQRAERLASAAGVSYEEAERELAREEGL